MLNAAGIARSPRLWPRTLGERQAPPQDRWGSRCPCTCISIAFPMGSIFSAASGPRFHRFIVSKRLTKDGGAGTRIAPRRPAPKPVVPSFSGFTLSYLPRCRCVPGWPSPWQEGCQRFAEWRDVFASAMMRRWVGQVHMRRLTEEKRDPEVAELLQTAAEYAVKSVGRILCRVDDDRTQPGQVFYDYVRMVLGLEVHFLFPNLSEAHRDMLVALMEVRNAVRIRFSKPGPAQTGDDPSGWSSPLSALKQRFSELRKQVNRSQVVANLTPLQQAILQSEFLAAPAPG